MRRTSLAAIVLSKLANSSAIAPRKYVPLRRCSSTMRAAYRRIATSASPSVYSFAASELVGG